MDARLPAHIEALGLIRQVQAAGGFGTVLQKGERDAGTIIVVLTESGRNARVYERLPSLDGSRSWHLSKQQSAENPMEVTEYLERRANQDRDTWIVELDIAHGERFIGLSTGTA